MRRSDRLFDLIQILRDGRLHRASDLARRLGVSERTLWRDMATLMASGLPVEGARGVGYILRAPITLPPMVLSATEMEALRRGVQMVADGADAPLARAARELAGKIAAVTPEAEGVFAEPGRSSARAAPHLPLLRAAIRGHERLAISYRDPDGGETHRDIRPLALETWGRVWVLAAFCEGRAQFQGFRVDRIVAVQPTGERFPDDPGRSLADYRAHNDRPRVTPPETRNSDPA